MARSQPGAVSLHAVARAFCAAWTHVGMSQSPSSAADAHSVLMQTCVEVEPGRPRQHLDGPAQQQCRAFSKAVDCICACNAAFLEQAAPFHTCSIRPLSSTLSSCITIAGLAAVNSKARLAAAWQASSRGHQAHCLPGIAQLISKPEFSPLLVLLMQHLPALGVS